MRFTTQLLPSRSGNLGICLLNNPKAFHALSMEMIYAFQDVLENWYSAESEIQAILVKSNPAELKRPAFCAGGDVKSIYTSMVDDHPSETHGQGQPGLLSADFFRHEYCVNHALATVPKNAYSEMNKTNSTNDESQGPVQISLWDGIVMGGGVGISIHGKYRVATENTVLAMPETAIGFFPDVGSLYWMPRLLSPSNAVYLALTGQRLAAADLMYAGLATHYVPSKQLPDLEAALVEATTQSSSVAPVLMSFHEQPSTDPSESTLAREKQNIQQAFGPALKDESYRVEDIVASLEKMKDSDFGRDTLAKLEKMSPTSLQVTLEGLRRGSKVQSMGENLVMEYRLSQHFMREASDFREGIRAMLVDKTSEPQWNPARLEDVTTEMIQSFFDEPIDHEWEIPATAKTSML